MVERPRIDALDRSPPSGGEDTDGRALSVRGGMSSWRDETEAGAVDLGGPNAALRKSQLEGGEQRVHQRFVRGLDPAFVELDFPCVYLAGIFALRIP